MPSPSAGVRGFPAYEPIYPGRGSVWSDKERLWIPEILNNRKEEHPNRTTVSGVGVQPQKEVDEAAKKKAGNPLFQEKSCVGNKNRTFILQQPHFLLYTPRKAVKKHAGVYAVEDSSGFCCFSKKSLLQTFTSFFGGKRLLYSPSFYIVVFLG